MAEIKERILLQMELDVDQLLQNIRSSVEAIALLKKQQEEANRKLKEMEAQGITTGATYENLARQTDQYRLTIIQEQKELKNNENLILTQARANNAAEGSYEQLLNQYKLASIELKNQEGLIQKNADGTFILTDAFKTASAKVESMKDTIIAFDQAIKDGRSNVGNYKSAIDSAFASFNASKDRVAELKFELAELNAKFKSGKTDQQSFNQQFAELTSELKIQTQETSKLGVKLDELKKITDDSGEGFKSLRQRLREARDEATLLQDKFTANLIPESDLIAAQKNLANLTHEQAQLNERLQAFNPEAKFKAFAQVGAGIAGGLEAANAAMGLLGDQSDDTAKAILKVQQFMALTQGLNEISKIGDSFKNLALVLGFTSTAQKAVAVANAETAATSQAAAVATGELAAAETTATATSATLGVALNSMLGPIGLIFLGIAAIVAAFNLIGTEKESVESLTSAIEGENSAHQKTLDVLKERNKEATSGIQNELDQAKARGQSEQELFDLRQKLRDANAAGLIKERAENQTHLDELAEQKKKFEAVIADSGRSEKEQKSASDEIKKIDEDLQKTLIRNAEITNVELKRIGSEHVTDVIETDRKVIEEQNKLSDLRIANIGNDHKREIEAQKQATKEAIDAIQDGEADAEEKRLLIAIQGEQKIADIERAFALKTLQEKNDLSIALTKEGTDARINAEIQSLQKERTQLLANVKLTEVERLKIKADTENKIDALEQNRIKLQQKNADAEIDVEKRKQDALQQIRSSLASTPDSAFEADKQNLKENTDFQLQQLELANQRKFEELSQERDREFQLGIQSASKEEQATQEFKDRQQKILDDGNKKIIENDEATSAERNKILLASGNDLIAITQKRFNAEAELKVLSLQRVQSEIETELATVERGSEREVELKRQLENVKIQIEQTGIDARIKGLDSEREAKGQLNAKEEAEYALLLQKKKELNAESLKERADQEAQANELIKQEAFKAFDEIFARIVDSSRRQSDQRIKDIKTTLDADLAALDEQQAREEGTFVQKTAIQIKYDNQRKALRDRAAAEERAIKIKQFETDRNAAAIEASIKGAVAFVEALPNYILAAAVGVTTGIEVGLILSQPTPEFSKGGFTDKGDPKAVATNLGRKPYIYHQNEYVIPDPVLKDPEVSKYVHSVIEPKRRGILPIFSEYDFSWIKNMGASQSEYKTSFADGGLANIPIEVLQTFTAQQITPEQIRAIVSETVSSLNVSVAVQDINEQQGIITKVESRSNH